MNILRNRFLSSIRANEKIAYDLNKYLAHHPEISGEEYQAVREICQILEAKNIEVEKNVAEIATSFVAHLIKGVSGSPKIGILMEYDALPEIGHACGHSASGSLSLLAALTLWEMRDSIEASIDLIGTPNEEVRGDKITLAHAGLFNDYDFVIMIHMNSNETWPSCHFLALSEINVQFKGQTAHAAASPWQGRNALNAAILTCNALDMLRQQLPEDTRVAYIIRQGGTASNIIPDTSEMIINMRNRSKHNLQETYQKVINCVKGASISTSTEYKIEKTGEDFDDMNLNHTGIKAIAQIMESIGLPHTEEPKGQATGSSDIGNVSYICPAFHPMMAISNHYFSLHTKEVADIMKSESINQVISQGAKVIGLFILKTLSEPELLQGIRQEFHNSIKP